MTFSANATIPTTTGNSVNLRATGQSQQSFVKRPKPPNEVLQLEVLFSHPHPPGNWTIRWKGCPNTAPLPPSNHLSWYTYDPLSKLTRSNVKSPERGHVTHRAPTSLHAELQAARLQSCIHQTYCIRFPLSHHWRTSGKCDSRQSSHKIQPPVLIWDLNTQAKYNGFTHCRPPCFDVHTLYTDTAIRLQETVGRLDPPNSITLPWQPQNNSGRIYFSSS